MEEPIQIKSHDKDYNVRAWQQYTLMELGNWVHNLHKRAFMRSDKAKAAKDLEDAQNYLLMMQAWLDEAKKLLK